MIERDMSQAPSIREPQLEPNRHVYIVLQDHGKEGGGWGPTAVLIPQLGVSGPIVYTGTDETTIKGIVKIGEMVYEKTGKPTKLVKFTEMEEVMSWD